MAATATHRVTCPDYTHEVASLESARFWLSGIERVGKCRNVHTIEVRDGDGWLPLHIATAREVLAAPLASTVATLDGELVKAAGEWSADASVRADAVADPRVDPAAWRAALGPHERATLTGDGRSVVGGWCRCEARPAAEMWVRYEQWTTDGRAGHGYACPACRGIVQAG